MSQLFLTDIISNKSLQKYRLLFDNLNVTPLKKAGARTGRPSVPKEALLKSFILKNLKGITFLTDLKTEIFENPSLAQLLGFNLKYQLPSIQRFSSFLKTTDNNLLQQIRLSLVNDLINLKIIDGKIVSIDSCPIALNVKENNLKTTVKNRYNKHIQPKADQDCKLGIMVHFLKPFQKKITYFWGYKNHVIVDSKSELPLHEVTKTANVNDKKVFIPLFKDFLELIKILPEFVTADAIYDSADVLEYIFNELLAKPVIPKNLRRRKNLSLFENNNYPQGPPQCMAGFQMTYWGKFRDKNRIRLKFVCPIHHRKKFKKQHPECPWNHPKFLSGKGCYTYIQAYDDVGIRNRIDYNTKKFKDIYNYRSSSERVFSRLLTLVMQKPSVYGLNSISNQCTIAHITILLVALTAACNGYPDKIRTLKNWFSNDLLKQGVL